MLEWFLMSNGENIDKFCNFYNIYDEIISLTGKKFKKFNVHGVFMNFLLNYANNLGNSIEVFNINELRACSGNCLPLKYKNMDENIKNWIWGKYFKL